ELLHRRCPCIPIRGLVPQQDRLGHWTKSRCRRRSLLRPRAGFANALHLRPVRLGRRRSQRSVLACEWFLQMISKFNSRLAQSHVIMLAKPTMYRLGPSNERSHHVYQPIPGRAHLMRFIPDDPVVYSAPSNDMEEQQKLLTSKLVRIVLEVGAASRPLAPLARNTCRQSNMTQLSLAP